MQTKENLKMSQGELKMKNYNLIIIILKPIF